MICMRYLWKPTFERQLIFGCAFEGILRLHSLLEFLQLFSGGRRKSLSATG